MSNTTTQQRDEALALIVSLGNVSGKDCLIEGTTDYHEMRLRLLRACAAYNLTVIQRAEITISPDDVRDKLLQVKTTCGHAVARGILAACGATKISDLPQVNYGYVMAQADVCLTFNMPVVVPQHENVPATDSPSARSSYPPTERALQAIAEERREQIAAHGYDPEDDNNYEDGQLASAAACYACPPTLRSSAGMSIPRAYWPWDMKHWRPSPADRKKELAKAGALIVAEIERLDRGGIVKLPGGNSYSLSDNEPIDVTYNSDEGFAPVNPLDGIVARAKEADGALFGRLIDDERDTASAICRFIDALAAKAHYSDEAQRVNKLYSETFDEIWVRLLPHSCRGDFRLNRDNVLKALDVVAAKAKQVDDCDTAQSGATSARVDAWDAMHSILASEFGCSFMWISTQTDKQIARNLLDRIIKKIEERQSADPKPAPPPKSGLSLHGGKLYHVGDNGERKAIGDAVEFKFTLADGDQLLGHCDVRKLRSQAVNAPSAEYASAFKQAFGVSYHEYLETLAKNRGDLVGAETVRSAMRQIINTFVPPALDRVSCEGVARRIAEEVQHRMECSRNPPPGCPGFNIEEDYNDGSFELTPDHESLGKQAISTLQRASVLLDRALSEDEMDDEAFHTINEAALLVRNTVRILENN